MPRPARSTAVEPPASQPAAAKPEVRFRMRVKAGDAIPVGPGKIALLEAVAATGSITLAAKSLGMSYRRAWLLLSALNGSLKSPAIGSSVGGQNGGGTALTPVGEDLIATYRRIEATAAEACAADIRHLLRMIDG